MGLEQGFSITRDLGCPRLALELQLDGDMTAQLVGSGAEARVVLQDLASGQRIYYSDLFARDAQGQELGTRLTLSAQTIRLEVDVTAAHYPVEVDPMLWAEQQKLTSSDGATTDGFGYAVAISGDTAVVGAYQKKIGVNTQQGEAYIYVRAGTAWSEQQKLIASDGTTMDSFGISVAISGDTAVVGAYQKKVGANIGQGQAYVYVRAGTAWSEQQKLIAATGAAGDNFGFAVAVSGDTAVIGANKKTVGANLQQGQAYVYLRTGTTWAEQQKLIAADGTAADRFGIAVAVSGDTAVIAAPYKKVGNNFNQGQAYVYLRAGTVWTEQQKLIATDGASPDSFGLAVGLSGDTAIVGAPNKQLGSNGGQGQAYVYLRAGTTWTEQRKLLAGDGLANDNYGIAVAVSGDTAIVGANQKTVNAQPSQGQAYVYARAGTTWTEQQKLIAADGGFPDQFGISVAVSKDTAVIGAFQKKVGANTLQGQAYVFLRTLYPNGTQCTLPGDCASGFCVASICCDSACGMGVCTTGQCRLLADLGLSMVSAPTGGVHAADFFVQVDNHGPAVATNVVVSIALPAQAQDVDVHGEGWTCTKKDSTESCTRPQAALGLQPPLAVRIWPPFDPTPVTLSAQVQADTLDVQPGDNSASASSDASSSLAAGCSCHMGATGPSAAAGWLLGLGALLGLRRRRRGV